MYGYPGLPSQTEKGIRNISVTIVIFLVVQFLVIGVLAAAMPLIALVVIGVPSGPPDAALVAAIFTVLALVCVLLIVYVVGLIFGVIGLSALHKGRDEFGPAHAQKIDRGIIFLILGIFVPFALSAVGSAGPAGGGAVGLTPRITAVEAIGGLASGVVGALFVGLFLLWSVEALVTPVLRFRAMLALIIGIASAAANGVGSLVVIYTVPFPTNPSQLGNFWLFLIPAIISAAISIVSLGLWFMAYRGVLDRFKRGELRAAPPMVYPPAYVSPYPAYGAPQYPPPVPPPQPPPPSGPPPGP